VLQLRGVHPLTRHQSAKQSGAEKVDLREDISTAGNTAISMADVLCFLVIATTTNKVDSGGTGGDARATGIEALKLGSTPVAVGTGPPSTITAVATVSAIGSL